MKVNFIFDSSSMYGEGSKIFDFWCESDFRPAKGDSVDPKIIFGNLDMDLLKQLENYFLFVITEISIKLGDDSKIHLECIIENQDGVGEDYKFSSQN